MVAAMSLNDVVNKLQKASLQSPYYHEDTLKAEAGEFAKLLPQRVGTEEMTKLKLDEVAELRGSSRTMAYEALKALEKVGAIDRESRRGTPTRLRLKYTINGGGQRQEKPRKRRRGRPLKHEAPQAPSTKVEKLRGKNIPQQIRAFVEQSGAKMARIWVIELTR